MSERIRHGLMCCCACGRCRQLELGRLAARRRRHGNVAVLVASDGEMATATATATAQYPAIEA